MIPDYNELQKIIKVSRIKENVFLSEYSTFKIGGKVNYVVEIEAIEDLIALVQLCFETQCALLCVGRGSNLLFSDRGFEGILMSLKGTFAKTEFNKKNISAGAGASLPLLVRQTAENSLTGLEKLIGIPGSIGGSVVNNSSACKQNLTDYIINIEAVDKRGHLINLSKTDLNFEYRSSSVKKDKEYIITRVDFELENDDRVEILNRINKYFKEKENNQPLNANTAGCIFKNGLDYSAGQLIDQAGLKGFSYGGARVSDIHANFIENYNQATSDDVLTLIQIIKEEIKRKFDKELELEIEII